MTQYKTFNTRSDADQAGEAVMRAYCASLKKAFPEPIEVFTLGRQPQPPEAYYQRNYIALREPGVDGIDTPHQPVDAFMRGLQGTKVVVTGGTEVTLDFSALVEVADATAVDAKAGQ